jgi:glycosyltransferase involved in cell wall biosynthesis
MERQAHELSKAVQARGVEILVLSGRTEREQPDLQEFEGVRIRRLPFARSKWLRFPLTGISLLVALWRERSHVDVVHAHNLSWFGGLAVLMAKLLRKPILAKLPTALEWAFREGSLRLLIFKNCDAIALLSQDTVEDFRRLGFPDSRIFKITNGVSTRLFSAAPAGTRDADTELRVLFVGRLDRDKGLLDLLAIWPNVVAQARQPVRLVVCGEGPQEAELRAAVRAMGLEGSVELKGRINDVASELQAASIFVLPSYVEGNSNAVLEAMAAGLPVLSTRVGGTPLLVGSEGADWLVEPRDRPGLEERLLRLVNDRSLRERAGKAMRARIEAHMTIEAVAERYCRAYDALARGRRDEVGAASSPVFS